MVENVCRTESKTVKRSREIIVRSIIQRSDSSSIHRRSFCYCRFQPGSLAAVSRPSSPDISAPATPESWADRGTPTTKENGLIAQKGRKRPMKIDEDSQVCVLRNRRDAFSQCLFHRKGLPLPHPILVPSLDAQHRRVLVQILFVSMMNEYE